MKIGLYGMPASGKTHLLKRVDFMRAFEGSTLLRAVSPKFDSLAPEGRVRVRQELAGRLSLEDDFIMDGHYSFGDEIAFTEDDGKLYDVFLYLFISPEILKVRISSSQKNWRYLDHDIVQWQEREIASIRKFCHENDKDFYILDNPPNNYFDDVSSVLRFIRVVRSGYSCLGYAQKCASEILKRSTQDTVTLLDGDRTLTIQDSIGAVLGYKTNIFDGRFYTGFQAWKQAEEFRAYKCPRLTKLPVSINHQVLSMITDEAYILTSGHSKIWEYIAREVGLPFFNGSQMAAETKFFITKILQQNGKCVIAFGDGLNDYYMLRQADSGYLVAKPDGSISRTLNGKVLEGLTIV